jgi:hypothetical protein
MTTRRRLLVFGLLAGLLVLGASVWLLLPRTAITRENAQKIQVGMTLAEVETILGHPAGDYRTNPQGPPPALVFPGDETVVSWYDDATSVSVVLDERGRVKHHGYSDEHPEPILSKVRRWLRL